MALNLTDLNNIRATLIQLDNLKTTTRRPSNFYALNNKRAVAVNRAITILEKLLRETWEEEGYKESEINA